MMFTNKNESTLMMAKMVNFMLYIYFTTILKHGPES